MLNLVNPLIVRLRELSIFQKIALSATLSLGIAVLGSLTGLYIGNYYQSQARLSLAIAQQQRQLLYDLENSIQAMHIHPQRLIMVLGDSIWFNYEAEKFLADVQQVENHIEQFQTFLDYYAPVSDVDVPTLRATLKQYQEMTQEYETWIQNLWQNLDPSKLTYAEIPEARTKIVTALSSQQSRAMEVKFDRLRETLLGLKKMIDQQEQDTERELVQAVQLRDQIILSSMVGSVIIAVILVIITSHAIAYPLKVVKQVARQVTEDSNFGLRCPQMTQDEIGSLAQAFNQLIERIDIYTKQLEEARNAADTANQAKSEFLANMSHELRTPLNGILGYTQILQRTEDLNRYRHGIEVIEQCGTHLLNLINDILDLSKIEARKMDLYPKDFHFPSFLSGVVEMSRIRAEQKGITFNYYVSSSLPEGIQADDKRLRQVLINLLSNGIKFTDVGSVTFTVDIVDSNFQISPPSVNLHFSVQDTGVGISSEKQEKIFLPFEQTGSHSRRAEGTGLGLTISQKIVQMMGSTIKLQSSPGSGSTFWFNVELPIVTEWANTSTIDDRGKIRGYTGSEKKVLIVDDKEVNRAVVVEVLTPLGFNCAVANNGEQGLAVAEQFQPDLILTDLVMPMLDGFEMTRRLRQISTLKNTIVIASSASVLTQDQAKSLEAGCDDFLPKPIEVEKLLMRLQKFLKLEWIYEEKSPSNSQDQPLEESTQTEWIVPPVEDIQKIHLAAKIGDIEKIEIETQRIKESDRRYIAFCDRVLEFALNFEDSAIVDLVEPYL